MTGQVRGVLVKTCFIFGVNNSSSFHTDNCKNIFLMLGEGLFYNINNSADAADKKFSMNFKKAKPRSCLSFHYNNDSSYSFVK